MHDGEADREVSTDVLALLRRDEVLTDSDIARATEAADRLGVSPTDVIVRLGLLSDDALARAMAKTFSVPLIAAADMPTQNLLEDMVSADFLREEKVVPVAMSEGQLTVAMIDPSSQFVPQALSVATGMRVVSAVASQGDIEAALDRILAPEVAGRKEARVFARASDEEVHQRLLDQASEAPVIRTVNNLLARAVNAGASDIHLEPYEQALILRYRIDGVLYDQPVISAGMAPAVISRLKLMAELDIAERRLAQDGRIRTVIAGHELDLRLSTLPTLHGEALVIRLLRQDQAPPDLSALGMSESVRKRLESVLKSRHGIFLSTGATGSGKTTTLYAILRQADALAEKIITVEDPIEYQLERITQVQVKHEIGLDFARVLRSVVRQDPDVIMVGETRDLETAEIAVQAALTGHLVFSTLHTNDAATAITRLLDMGIDDYLVASTVNGVLGQRLVRTLCPDCKAPYAPSEEVLDRLNIQGVLRDEPFYKPTGCKHCQGRGYRGRTGLFELMIIDENIRKQIIRRKDASLIAQMAQEGGMVPLSADGVAKAAKGLTSLEEVARVTRMH